VTGGSSDSGGAGSPFYSNRFGASGNRVIESHYPAVNQQRLAAQY